MSILDNIVADKRIEVALRKGRVPVSSLERGAVMQRVPLSLSTALAASRPAIIAEIKKASPSKGVIRLDFDPVAIAKSYIAHGALALSVLTDEKYFGGKLEYLTAIRAIASVPVLRKDFVIDPYQIIEAKHAGADAVLLIAAVLESHTLHDLIDVANSYQLECLVEVHSLEEMDRLDFTKVKLLGINNRNLKTFEVSLETTRQLAEQVPDSVTCVSESGIALAEDMRMLMRHGVHAFLIGESLMRSPDPGEALGKLLAAFHGVNA